MVCARTRPLFLGAALSLGAVPPAHAQTPPGPVATPPSIEAVLKSDTLVVDSLFLGEDRSYWPFEFVRVAPIPGRSLTETWMRLEDPFGGTFFGPATMVANLGEEAVAFQEGHWFRSVFYLPSALAFALLVLLAVGLTTLAGSPFVWYRRRLRAERGRRAAADLARRHLAEGRESERARLARELHDGPVQDLYALRARLARAAGPAPEALAEAEAEVRRVVAELRAVSEALRPPALGPYGLAAALRALAERAEQAHPALALHLHLEDDGQALPEAARLALFRIAQEALNNALRHADASQVWVAFRLSPGPPREVTLEVVDDGRGFAVPADLSAPAAAGHYGLAGMAERAEAVGAALRVTSRPGETRVHARLPLSPSP